VLCLYCYLYSLCCVTTELDETGSVLPTLYVVGRLLWSAVWFTSKLFVTILCILRIILSCFAAECQVAMSDIVLVVICCSFCIWLSLLHCVRQCIWFVARSFNYLSLLRQIEVCHLVTGIVKSAYRVQHSFPEKSLCGSGKNETQ